MKKTKKLFTVSCSIMLMLALTGCKKEETAESRTSADGTRTITSLGYDSHGLWDNRENHKAWLALQKMLAENKLKIESEVTTAEQYEQILQTRIASGKDLPDIINASYLDLSTLINLGERGILLDIKEFLETYSDGTALAFIEKYFPDIWNSVQTPDGKAYWLPQSQIQTYKDTPFAHNLTALVRSDWCERLGIELPTTLEEYKNMLIAFQENDMNGNGKKDEKANYTPSFNYIAPSFGLPTSNVAVDIYEGVAKSPWLMEKELAEFVRYIKELIDLGLIDIDAWDRSGEVSTQKRQANEVSSVFSYHGAQWFDSDVAPYGGAYLPVMLGKEKGDIPITYTEPPTLYFNKIAITKEAKDLQAIADFLDMCFTEEYATLGFYGIEGEGFTVNEDGLKIFHPESKSKDFYTNQAAGKQLWGYVGYPIFQLAKLEGYLQGDPEPRRTLLTQFAEDYCIDGRYYYQADYMLAVPTLEESERLVKLNNDISTYASETLRNLCLGVYKIDSIPKHSQFLQDLGLHELMDIYQARHDRFIQNRS